MGAAERAAHLALAERHAAIRLLGGTAMAGDTRFRIAGIVEALASGGVPAGQAAGGREAGKN
ncbi:MAG TPA: hypothetical protein PLH72_02435 [Vicinamibacterales bacterium]|nr:hypothetical protein [Vicinamibacterales bacterium]